MLRLVVHASAALCAARVLDRFNFFKEGTCNYCARICPRMPCVLRLRPIQLSLKCSHGIIKPRAAKRCHQPLFSRTAGPAAGSRQPRQPNDTSSDRFHRRPGQLQPAASPGSKMMSPAIVVTTSWASQQPAGHAGSKTLPPAIVFTDGRASSTQPPAGAATQCQQRSFSQSTGPAAASRQAGQQNDATSHCVHNQSPPGKHIQLLGPYCSYHAVFPKI